ncbi:Mediator of RNA polymerase II transcription subunit 13-like protein [Platysternon megacephalum]|uniref:Mediator of RNA polymerase II transcription subunit 13-like protein n=1 Tax=Platysternon megacephalum TaxID=55544 RepID=A0A4D9E4A4_9SAUR|nr:Mediator of RNA polymerase II transcription subunit 13-like protein [Platysternon megacephalum]
MDSFKAYVGWGLFSIVASSAEAVMGVNKIKAWNQPPHKLSVMLLAQVLCVGGLVPEGAASNASAYLAGHKYICALYPTLRNPLSQGKLELDSVSLHYPVSVMSTTFENNLRNEQPLRPN